jgi:hypothetical protein
MAYSSCPNERTEAGVSCEEAGWLCTTTPLLLDLLLQWRVAK